MSEESSAERYTKRFILAKFNAITDYFDFSCELFCGYFPKWGVFHVFFLPISNEVKSKCLLIKKFVQCLSIFSRSQPCTVFIRFSLHLYISLEQRVQPYDHVGIQVCKDTNS